MNKRMQEDERMTYIDLDQSEHDVYRGTGWALAQFDNDELVATHYLLGDYDLKDAEAGDDEIQTATKAAVKFCKGRQNLWLGMMSSYQFCNPEPFKPGYTPHIARIARLIGESLYSE